MLQLFSADDHIIEPADVWTNRVPAKYRQVAPHVVEEDGREYWVYEDQRNETMGLNAVVGKRRDQYNPDPDPVLRHAARLLRPEGAGQGHAAGRDPRQRPVPDAAPVLGHALPRASRTRSWRTCA